MPRPILSGALLLGIKLSVASGASATRIFTVCEALRSGLSLDGQIITLRGLLRTDAHSVVLIGSACGRHVIFLERESGFPDPMFCDSAALTERYGCPAGAGRRHLMVTWTGRYKMMPPGDGTLWVQKLENVVEERHGT